MAQNHEQFDLEALQQGEPQAIEAWFEKYSDAMFAFVEPDRKIDNRPLKGGFSLGYRAKGMVFGLYNNRVHFIQIQTPRPPKQ
jgi:hypothetical protein